MLYAHYCRLRRLLRRYSWHLLAPLFILAYPVGWAGLLMLQGAGLVGDEFGNAIAQAAAKTIDPLLFLCHLGVSVAVFCSINFLGFVALNVTPVVVNWATGRYNKKESYEAVGLAEPVRGFKYTFLTITPLARIVLYVAVWALELAVGGYSLSIGFSTL